MPTLKFQAGESDWTDLGSTPLFVQSCGPSVVYVHVDGTKPAPTAEGIVLHRSCETSANITTTGQRAWARKGPGLTGTQTVTVVR